MTVSESIIYDSQSFRGLQKVACGKNPSHAYLLSGASIETLSAVAESFGKWLHCETSQSIPCNTCSSCNLHTSNTHPAISTIRGTGNEISIDSVREIIDRTTYKTRGNLHRIFIVEEVASITEEGANAFLKTLEEPPEGTVFILLTTKPTAVMKTIASRCIMVRISLPSPEIILKNYLSDIPVNKGILYVSLLLSDCSPVVIDSLSQGILQTFDPQDASLSSLSTYAKDMHFDEKFSFFSNPSYLLTLFCGSVNWLEETMTSSAGFENAVKGALFIEESNRVLETSVENWFKNEEKSFKESYGKKNRDLNLVATVKKRMRRKIVSENITLFTRSIETALRLGLQIANDSTDNQKLLIEVFPRLEFCQNLAPEYIDHVRAAVKRCRQQIMANVTEKAMLTTLCLALTSENSTFAVQ